jgi:hypothetical protein
MEPAVEMDAREFAVWSKSGEWRLGLLVARNVEPSQGKRTDLFQLKKVEKVSASEFAKVAGTSAARVLRYLDAWDRAAAAGYVPHSTTLSPGDEVDLDADRLPPWQNYYTTVVRAKATTSASSTVRREPANLEGLSTYDPAGDLFCNHETANEMTERIGLYLDRLLGWRYELNDEDLSQIKQILSSSLEVIENYGNGARTHYKPEDFSDSQRVPA